MYFKFKRGVDIVWKTNQILMLDFWNTFTFLFWGAVSLKSQGVQWQYNEFYSKQSFPNKIRPPWQGRNFWRAEAQRQVLNVLLATWILWMLICWRNHTNQSWNSFRSKKWENRNDPLTQNGLMSSSFYITGKKVIL